MNAPYGKTTAPGAATTAEDAGERPSYALIIASSASQPHRVGEIAFFPLGKRLYVGRGPAQADELAYFGPQQPGEVLAVDPLQGILEGATVSRRQLEVCSTGEGLEVEKVGQCRTYINGQEVQKATKATLRPGDTVMFRNEVVLLCVLRPRMLPALPAGFALHAFGEPDADGIVGESPAAWRMRAELARVAAGSSHVLIRGESGTGKELAAAVIHHRSNRARGPLVSRNAAVFTSTLIASELFGSPANYPNPGMPARKGLLGTADGGTFFLDEIGDCPLEVQAQLLRVMDQGEYQAVGEATVRHVDVRFVGATNRDESLFREDFLARVHLPPLRERREDIPLLARHFLLQQSPERNVDARRMDALLRHPLPANVRDLHKLLQAVEASPGDAQPSPAPPARRAARAAQGSAAQGTPSREDILAEMEREEWKVARVARRFGMERTALYRLMKSYGIEPKAPE
jgi:transcriptional regulator with AAA-type ATPase domain